MTFGVTTASSRGTDEKTTECGRHPDDHHRKSDQQRLLAAAEPEKQAAVKEIIDKMWSGDGYPQYQRLRSLYGSDEAAQELYKRAGFQGLSGQVDGPEVLLFGSQPTR